MKFLKLLPTVCALLLGIAIALVFNHRPGIPAMEIKPAELKKQAALTEQRYEIIVDSFKYLSQQAAQQLTTTRNELTVLQQKNNLLRAEIKIRVRKEVPVTKEDGLEKLNDCDSLQSITALLLEQDEQKDSLSMLLNNTCSETLGLKDSIIKSEEEKYAALKQNYNRSIGELEKAATSLRQLTLQNRRRTTHNKIVTIAIAVVSGIAAGILLK